MFEFYKVTCTIKNLFFNIILCYSQNGVSALIVAAENGHIDVMESLLQHKASLELKRNVSGTLEHIILIFIVYLK